jgi:hypothetical protein
MFCEYENCKNCENVNRESMEQLTRRMFRKIITMRHRDFIRNVEILFGDVEIYIETLLDI